jgi:hypothetical protein
MDTFVAFLRQIAGLTVQNAVQQVQNFIQTSPAVAILAQAFLQQLQNPVSQTTQQAVQQFISSSPYSLRGFYGPAAVQDGSFIVYFTDQTKLPISNGWVISGLPNILGNVSVTQYNSNVYGDVVINPGPPSISFPYISNAFVVSDVPNDVTVPSSIVRLTVLPPPPTGRRATANAVSSFGLYEPDIYNTSNIVGTEGDLRSFSSNIVNVEGRNTYTTVVQRGAGLGALISLAAIGAQEPYMYGGYSHWIPRIRQHTPFTLSQRMLVPVIVTGQMLGQLVQIPIPTRDAKDLISNMYLTCTLPALSGYSYCEMVGRALFSTVELLIDGISYELLTDDWYMIHDQLFLDADEKMRLYQALNAGYPENQTVPAPEPISLRIPLQFFFSRSKYQSRPYFPTCALSQSQIIVRIQFHSAAWITNAPSDANGKPVDISNVRLLLEEVSLSPVERVFFVSQPQTFKIPQVWREAVQGFTSGQVRVNFTANFPVTMMAWFFRNKTYENQTTDPNAPNFSQQRYNYGYSTQYNKASTPVTFFNGTKLNFIDVIDTATLYINNQNILSNFPGSLYYSYRQPTDHSMSIPTKNIYMYCFGKNPHVLSGGLDFSKLNYQTSHLDMSFLKQYATEITANYNLHVYYYGYRTVRIQGGQILYV